LGLPTLWVTVRVPALRSSDIVTPRASLVASPCGSLRWRLAALPPPAPWPPPPPLPPSSPSPERPLAPPTPPAAAGGPADATHTGFSEIGGAVRIKDPVLVQALTRLSPPIATITIGDTSGLLRDASNRAGWPAVSTAALPCSSTRPGFSFAGDVHDVLRLSQWRRAIIVPDWHQQAARMGLGMAAVKASDGRMFACMATWLLLWCTTAAAVCIMQPDIFVVDFYDAPFAATSPDAWGDYSGERTLLFCRGAAMPVPPDEGSRKAALVTERVQAQEWAPSFAKLARGVATQLVPDGSGPDLQFAVEIERLAAAVYSAGIPIPPWYSRGEGEPPEQAERAYMHERGLGDRRRLDGRTVPRLARRDLGDPTWRDGISEHATPCPGRAARGSRARTSPR
jgi:hypothetical protein